MEGEYSYVWEDLQLDVRYVELNHPKIVAQRILSLEKEVSQLKYVNTINEEIIKEYKKRERRV